MTGSAIIGQPPSNQDDFDIIRGLLRVMGIPDDLVDPAKGLPLPVKRPTDDHYPDSYPNQGPRIVAAMCVAILLVLAITGARVALRFFRRDLHWGWEDIVILPAALGVVSWLSIVIAMVAYGGAGKHIYDVTYLEVHWFIRLAAVDQFLFWLTVGFIKVSITLFNRRLTGLTSNRWMIAHNVFLCLLIVYMITALFLNTLSCVPPLSQFSLIKYGSLPTAPRCMNANAVGIALSIVHIAFDFALLSVPLIVLWKIKMSTTKKLRVSFLFSVGAISCIGSVMRQIKQYRTSIDTTWNLDVINWTTVDIFFAITAASLPVLNSIIPQRWRVSSNSLPRLVSWSGRRGSHKESRRQESEDTFQPLAPFSRMSQLNFHNEQLLDYDSQETIHGGDVVIKSDSKDVVPKLEFQRGASLENDRDIEKYIQPTDTSFESRWDDRTELQPPYPAYRPGSSLAVSSTY